MEIYNYHPETGEFLSPGRASVDQLTPGNWLVPAFATCTAPPPAPQGTANVFKDGAWMQVEDHRGEQYWYGEMPVTMTGLGAVPPVLSTIPPKRRWFRLIDNWRAKMTRLHSMRAAIFGAAFWSAVSGGIMIWPALADHVPTIAYAIGGIVLSIAFGVARLLKQPGAE